MMRKRFLLRLTLIAALLAACTPEAPTANPPAAASKPPAAVSTATVEPVTGTDTAVAETALPVATSRGPELHATDPVTVSLASGGLQFVEFFRFT